MKNTEVFHRIFFAFNSALYSASSNKYLYHRFLSCLGVIFMRVLLKLRQKEKLFLPLHFFAVWNLLLKCCEKSRFVKLVTSKYLN